jgi:hypothetical protein
MIICPIDPVSPCWTGRARQRRAQGPLPMERGYIRERVEDGRREHLHQRPDTPERFEFRQVAVGQTFGNLVQLTNGLRESNVSSFATLTRCPDNDAVNE